MRCPYVGARWNKWAVANGLTKQQMHIFRYSYFPITHTDTHVFVSSNLTSSFSFTDKKTNKDFIIFGALQITNFDRSYMCLETGRFLSFIMHWQIFIPQSIYLKMYHSDLIFTSFHSTWNHISAWTPKYSFKLFNKRKCYLNIKIHRLAFFFFM